MKLITRNIYLWHPSRVTDQAAFHQLLSSCAIYRRTRRGELLEDADSLTHHSKAMQIVQSRTLDVDASVSDGNIAAIAGLCEYSVGIITYVARIYALTALNRS